jgi:hypothetical protein
LRDKKSNPKVCIFLKYTVPPFLNRNVRPFLGVEGEKKTWVFEKIEDCLGGILCYTHGEAQRAYGLPAPGRGVLPLFPFCSRSVPAFTCLAYASESALISNKRTATR